MNTNRFRYAGALVMLSTAFVSLLGCAGSNPSFTRVNKSVFLNVDDINNASKKIVDEMIQDPRFLEYQSKDKKNGIQTVVFMCEYVNQSGDTRMDETEGSFQILFSALEEQFLKYNVPFRQDLDSGNSAGALKHPITSRASGIEAVDKQDSDPRYDPKSGKVTTSAALKAVLGLQLELTRLDTTDGKSAQFCFVLRARLIDGETKVTLVSKKVEFQKTN